MTWTDIAQLVAANPPTPREIAEVYANIRRRAKARFYADENFPTRATHILRAMRARVRTAQEAHLLGRSDEDHLAYARREESILLTCDRDFLDERRFPLVHSPVLFVFDFGSGSEYEIRLAFRCLKTVLQMPQFFDKWWNIDAGRHGVSDVSGQPVKAIEDTLPLYPDLTVEETSAVMEAIQQRRPEVTTFGSKASSDPTASPPMGLSTLLEGLYTWRPPTSDQIERYKKAHAEWVTNARKALDQLGAGLNLRHRIRKLQIALANTGSRPADEVLVEFKIYGAGTLLVRVGDHVPKLIAEAEKLPHGVVLPPPPTPPKGEYVYERFARNAQYGLGHRDWTEALRIPDYFDIRASLAKHDRHEFYRREDDEKPMAEASFRCEEFRHQRPLQLFSLWIPVPVECATVQARLHIRASARNLRTPVDLHIPVDVRSEHRSTYEIAWAWHIEA